MHSDPHAGLALPLPMAKLWKLNRELRIGKSFGVLRELSPAKTVLCPVGRERCAGLAVLTCHMSLVSGTPVAEATRTTTAGGCDVIETPSGRAIMTCFRQL